MYANQMNDKAILEDEDARLFATASPDPDTGKLLTADGRDLAAVLLGRRGGLKGGKARAATMSAERRSEVARLAARKRWEVK